MVFPGAGFTDFIPAQKIFSVIHYPVRTAVKIVVYKKGQMFQWCSGIMVSKDLILTASHCVYGAFDSLGVISFIDSVLILPGFDNGSPNPMLKSAVSAAFIIPQSNIQDNYLSQDVALIKVREPIGSEIGWVGISYFRQDSSLKNKVLHKLSYPMKSDMTDPLRIFNGDTLYYNYGTLDVVNQDGIGYFIEGIPGQSGSSLLMSDNGSIYSAGVQNWGTNSMHYRFSEAIYRAMKNIIVDGTKGVDETPELPMRYSVSNVYPNPFNPTASIEYTLGSDAVVSIEICDILGRVVREVLFGIRSQGTYRQSIDAAGMPSGIYFLRFKANDHTELKKIVLLK